MSLWADASSVPAEGCASARGVRGGREGGPIGGET